MKITPVEYAASVFGGVRALGRAINTHPSNVCRWKRPRPYGMDGEVSHNAFKKIIAAAEKLNLKIDLMKLTYGATVRSTVKKK